MRLLEIILTCGLAAKLAAGETANAPLAEQRRPSPGRTTYHIHPVVGDDRHAGTARDAAWKSFQPLSRLTLAAGDRVEILAPGRYDFHPAHAHRETYQISNTNDDPEGRKAVAILLGGAKHLRFSGPGASVVCRGKHAVSAKSTQGLRVTGNSIQSDSKAAGDAVVTRDCQEVFIGDNHIMPDKSQ